GDHCAGTVLLGDECYEATEGFIATPLQGASAQAMLEVLGVSKRPSSGLFEAISQAHYQNPHHPGEKK
ncbi:MAG: hypothetical protein NZM37_04925, partial [Sandaracinaceae bacterium]|nr:hypothetical protein [Sandaracinaceae bacterium]